MYVRFGSRMIVWKSFPEAIRMDADRPGNMVHRRNRAIRDERFYILTHPEFNPIIELRMKDILSGANPTVRRGLPP
jgi:hypothetical protein